LGSHESLPVLWLDGVCNQIRRLSHRVEADESSDLVSGIKRAQAFLVSPPEFNVAFHLTCSSSDVGLLSSAPSFLDLAATPPPPPLPPGPSPRSPCPRRTMLLRKVTPPLAHAWSLAELSVHLPPLRPPPSLLPPRSRCRFAGYPLLSLLIDFRHRGSGGGAEPRQGRGGRARRCSITVTAGRGSAKVSGGLTETVAPRRGPCWAVAAVDAVAAVAARRCRPEG